MTKFIPAMLKQIAPHLPSETRAAVFPVLVRILDEYKINTYLRVAAFLGQVLLESGEFTRWEENLNYSAKRLCQVWPKRFPSIASAAPYAYNPEALAEKVYGGRMGNNKPGDGYKYRGRGPEQTTGYNSYKEAQQLTKYPLIDDPDLLTEYEIGFKVAAARWVHKGLNTLADQRKFKEITLTVNGGLTGYPERLTYYTRALRNLPEDLVLSDNQGSEKATLDTNPPDVHESIIKPDVMLPTNAGVEVPAVVTEEGKEAGFSAANVQNIVTGHSDSVKSIVTRAGLKFLGWLVAVWCSGVAGKLFLIAMAIILVVVVVYEVNKYWPRVKGFVLKWIKKQ